MQKLALLTLITLLFGTSSSYGQCRAFGGRATDYDHLNPSRSYSDPGVTEYIRLMEQLIEKFFQVDADIFFTSSSNPYAEAYRDNPNGKDGTVILYRGLIEKLYPVDRVRLALILAHEYGHIMQYRLGDGPLVQKEIELHADYLAGFFTYIVLQIDGRLGVYRNFEEWLDVIYTAGEFGDTNYNSPYHHGTQAEREQAVTMGYATCFGGPPQGMQVRSRGDGFFDYWYSNQWMPAMYYYFYDGRRKIDKVF